MPSIFCRKRLSEPPERTEGSERKAAAVDDDLSLGRTHTLEQCHGLDVEALGEEIDRLHLLGLERAFLLEAGDIAGKRCRIA